MRSDERGERANLEEALPCLRKTGNQIWVSDMVQKLTKFNQRKLQNAQNKGHRRMLEAYNLTLLNALHKDAEILPVAHRKEETATLYAVHLNRTTSPREPVYQLRPAAPGGIVLGALFADIQALLELIKDSYWTKGPPWKKVRRRKKEKEKEEA